MDLKRTVIFIAFFIIFIAPACSSPASTMTQASGVSPTDTTAPSETATANPESSLTTTPALLGLEILEWSEWPYANPADPSNTDTHVEVLIRNPNDVAVKVNHDEDELRFISAAGEVVYRNPSSIYYIWQGEWMLPGETAALSACVCFWSSGMEKQDWESLQLVAPLEIATDISYTLDVEVTAEFILLEEVLHGYSGPGVATTLTNTSDQVLESISTLVFAYDASGRYVGMATFGNAVASWTENIGIQPGDTASGFEVSQIDYLGNERLTYEVAAIGIPYRAAPEVALPSGTPLTDWNGIPIMPGALAGESVDGGYQFTIAADLVDITAFYETELSDLGFEVELNVDETTGQAILDFRKDAVTGLVVIAPLGGGLNGIGIIINQ